MKEKTIYLCLLFALGSANMAIAQVYTWMEDEGLSQTYGSELIVESSQDIICFGTDSIYGKYGLDTHMYLSSRDQNGLPNWSLSIAPSTSGVYGYSGRSFAKTSDGGYILGGLEQGFSGTSACIVKLDNSSAIDWHVLLPEPNTIISVRSTNDGGYVCTTSTNGVYRLNSSGGIVWSIDLSSGIADGNMEITNSGDIIISHNELVTPTLTQGKVISYSDNGLLNWEYTDIDNSLLFGLTISSTGSIIVGGRFSDNTGSHSRIVKLNSTGSLEWANNYDLFDSSDDSRAKMSQLFGKKY